MKSPIHHIALVICACCISFSTYSQEDTTSTNAGIELNRPMLELGVGTFNYFGDVGKLNGIGSTSHLNWGYRIAFKNQLSNSFNADLFFLFGSITANERLVDNDVNFESKIRMGGLSISYNFNALLPEDRKVTPYISLGIASYDFSTKSDLYDAQGRFYNYWDDGSIRDIAQNDPNAGNAVEIQRDYDYETDLRKFSDREGDYDLRAVTIPVGIGAELEMTPSFTLRLGTEFHIGLSDNLDNINDDSYESTRSGNDHFMYSSIGLAYNLKHKKKAPKESFLPMSEDLLALEYEDEDQDGIADIIDHCPGTPAEADVDEFGCPLDGDKDGVPDYLDLEPNSVADAKVNSDGVALTDEEISAMYKAYLSDSGEMTYVKSATYTADLKLKRKISQSNGYRVTILDSDDLSSDEIASLLSIKDVKFIETASGGQYYLGTYQSLTEAVEKQMMVYQFDTEIEHLVDGQATMVGQEDIAGVMEGIDASHIDPDVVVFRVQIGAYRYRLSKDVFKEVPDLLVIEGNDGLTRYVSGSFYTIQEAAEHKVDLLLKGFEGAFVTAYRGGKRIKLKEAGATVNSKENIEAKESGQINKDLVKYTVKIGAFEGRVPAETLGEFMNLGGVRPVRNTDGITTYVYGMYNSFEEAEHTARVLKEDGFEDAEVVGDFNGKIIDADEAKKIKGE